MPQIHFGTGRKLSRLQHGRIQELRRAYLHADAVKVASDITIVFNIRGNHYRLVVAIHYNTQTNFCLQVLTHSNIARTPGKTTCEAASSQKRNSWNVRASGPPRLLCFDYPIPAATLRSEQDYNAAASILDKLAVRPEGSLSRGEQDYFDTLTLLIEEYDRDIYELPDEPNNPLEMLKYILDESGMTQAELGKLLGNRSLASLILNGHRQLSKAHIRKLADHFKVSPALFLE